MSEKQLEVLKNVIQKSISSYSLDKASQEAASQENASQEIVSMETPKKSKKDSVLNNDDDVHAQSKQSSAFLKNEL